MPKRGQGGTGIGGDPWHSPCSRESPTPQLGRMAQQQYDSALNTAVENMERILSERLASLRRHLDLRFEQLLQDRAPSQHERRVDLHSGLWDSYPLQESNGLSLCRMQEAAPQLLDADVSDSSILPPVLPARDEDLSDVLLIEKKLYVPRHGLQDKCLVTRRTTSKHLGNESLEDLVHKEKTKEDLLAQTTHHHPVYILGPSSGKRVVWDLLGMLFIFYDLVTIPWQLAFKSSSANELFNIMFKIALGFWMLDFVLAFFTGFYGQGTEVLKPRRIVLNYCRTWMMFDLSVILTDWVALYADNVRAPALVRMGKPLRVLKVFRSLRLLRLLKLQRLAVKLLDRIDSEHIHICITMLKGALIILGLNHVIACSWYWVSDMTSTDTDSWVKRLASAGAEEVEPSDVYIYLTSLHWSLTQFTPASMEVVPRNLHERAFSVCILVFALLVFPSFLASITASMTQLRQISWKYDRNLGVLRKYLGVHGISTLLSIRITKFVEYQLALRKTGVRESDVALLNILSAPLKMSLVQEKSEPWLKKNPFFHRYALVNPTAMKEICSKAVQVFSYSKGDVVFTEDDTSNAMLLLQTGEMEYCQADNDRRYGNTPTRKYQSTAQKEGSWCSEAALWTDWKHVGLMTATDNSECLAVDAEQFVKKTRSFKHVFQATVCYSAAFVKWLNVQMEHDRLSDIEGPSEGDVQSLVGEAFGELATISFSLTSSKRKAGEPLSGAPPISLLEAEQLTQQQPEQEQDEEEEEEEEEESPTQNPTPMQLAEQGREQYVSGISESSQGQMGVFHHFGWPIACLPHVWSPSQYR